MVFLHLTNEAYLDRIRTTYYIEEHTLLEEHITESLLPNIKVTPVQYNIRLLVFCWRQQKFPKNDEKLILTKNGKNFIIYIHCEEDI